MNWFQTERIGGSVGAQASNVGGVRGHKKAPGTGIAGISLEDLARLRQGAYRLFSQSLLYPDDQRLAVMPVVVREMAVDEAWGHIAPVEEWRDYLALVAGLQGRRPADIQAEYLSLFVVNVKGVPCPPYESAYVSGGSLNAGWLGACLAAEYSREGLAPSPASGEPPDHVATELEFMSFLCNAEAVARQQGDPQRAQALVTRQQQFLEQHLDPWIPLFEEKVRVSDSSGFYAGAVKALLAFIGRERAVLGSSSPGQGLA